MIHKIIRLKTLKAESSLSVKAVDGAELLRISNKSFINFVNLIVGPQPLNLLANFSLFDKVFNVLEPCY